MEYIVSEGKLGLKIAIFGPFSDPRSNVEECASKIKHTQEAHRCWWDAQYVYFYIKQKSIPQ